MERQREKTEEIPKESKEKVKEDLGELKEELSRLKELPVLTVADAANATHSNRTITFIISYLLISSCICQFGSNMYPLLFSWTINT